MSQDARALLRLVRQVVGHHEPRLALWGLVLILLVGWLGDSSLGLLRALLAGLAGPSLVEPMVVVLSGLALFALYRRALDAWKRRCTGPVSVRQCDTQGIRGLVAALSPHKDAAGQGAGLTLEAIGSWVGDRWSADAILAELGRHKHPWEMSVRLLRDIESLEAAIFVLSREAVEHWPVFRQLALHCLGERKLELRAHTELMSGHSTHGLDVVIDFSGLLSAFDACVQDLAASGLPSNQVALDITSGNKLCSAAAAMVALDRDRRMLYLWREPTRDRLVSFDARYETVEDDPDR